MAMKGERRGKYTRGTIIRLLLTAPIGAALLLVACSEPAERAGMAPAGYAAGSKPSSPPAAALASPVPPSEQPAGSADKVPPQGEVPHTPARKIVYNADIDIVVDDFAKAEAALMKLVDENNGYLSSADVNGSPGKQRSGTWKVRVPVERFRAFLDSVSKLGELQRRQANSQDVTEEYYDLEARIKNKKVEEARLLKHLEESTGKLKEILDVEREISRVREEVERQEGRLRLLENLSSLTTVSIVFHEREGYIPPEAPSFGTQIARTFFHSFESLVDFGKAIVIAVVAISPWLPVLFVVGLILLLIVRRVRLRLSALLAEPSRPSSVR
jgi:hypothetical protein